MPRGRPFPKGVSGNPGGRPVTKPQSEAYRKVLSLSPAEREKFKPTNGYEEIALAQIALAAGSAATIRQGVTVPLDPDTSAAKEITDRLEGKVAMPVEAGDNLAGAIHDIVRELAAKKGRAE